MTYPTIRRGGLESAVNRFYRPRPPTTQLDGHPDIDLIRGAPARIVAIRAGYVADAAAASRAVMADARLSRKGIHERDAAARHEVATRYRAELDQLEQEVIRAVDALRDDEEDTRPQPLDGVDAYMDRQRRRGDAERLHAAGIDVATQVNEADSTETVFALLELIPVTLRIAGADADTVGIHIAHATRRLHELAGPAALTAYDAAREAEALAAELEQSIAYTRGQLGVHPRDQGSGLHEAITAMMTRAQVKAAHQRALDLRGSV